MTFISRVILGFLLVLLVGMAVGPNVGGCLVFDDDDSANIPEKEVDYPWEK
jgi:hypothetical protein